MDTEQELRIECLRAASGVTIAMIAKGTQNVTVVETAQEMYAFLNPKTTFNHPNR